jgi:hypothetical protein
MTLRALQATIDMGGMSKKNIIRNAVHRYPGNAFVFLGRRAQLRDLGAILFDRLVASHAESGGREFGFVARVYAGVADLAGHFQLTGVNLVAESNGLRRNGFRQLFSVFYGFGLLLGQGSMHEAKGQ